MRYAHALLALSVVGCISDVALEIEVRAPAGVPEPVVSWELRLVRLEGDERCPSADSAARAAPTGRLAHTQTFETEGMAVGDVPEGRWGFALLARDVDCGVRMYGCREIEIGSGVASPIVIDVNVATTAETCGCRTCEAGVCAGPDVCP